MHDLRELIVWAADEGVSVWWVAAAGAFCTVLTGVVTAVITLLSSLRTQQKQKRTDALEEWQEIAERQQSDLDKLVAESRAQAANYDARMNALQAGYDARLNDLQAREVECRVKSARQEGEIRLLESTVRRLQRLAGDEAPATTTPGLVIADTRGIIREASPALTPTLHWMPHELRGKSVEVLMPERYKEPHRKAMAAALARGEGPWPERVVLGEALTKEGEEVPVTIALSGWQTASGDWLISAEVRPRGADGGPPAVSQVAQRKGGGS